MSENSTPETNLPPPVPPTPESVPSIVDTLDPDLAAAYRAGNASVIQAVASGMTTNAMIVNDLIRTGASMGNMPAAIQQMVADRRKEMEQEEADKQARMAKALAAVVGAGMMASNIAHGSEFYGQSGNSQTYSAYNPPNSYQFSQMNEAERTAYFNSLSQMSVQQWGGDLSRDQRDQHLANVGEQNRENMMRAGNAVHRAVTQMEADGLTKEEIALVQGTIDVPHTPDSPEGREAIRRNREALAVSHPYLARYVDSYQSAVTAVYAGAAGANATHEGQQANQRDDHAASHAGLQAGIGKIEESTVALKSAPTFMECRRRPEGAPEVSAEAAATPDDAAAVHAKADAVMLGADKIAKSSADVAKLQEATEANVASGIIAAKAADASATAAAIAKGGTVAKAVMGDMDDDEPAAARPPSVTATALGPNGTAGLNQLGAAPADLVAANDTPEMQQRKPQASQGMSAGA